MKWIMLSGIFLFLTVLITTSTAHSFVTGNQILVDGKTITAGTTPDSWLYGLDVAIDQIRYLLTFDNTAKAKLGLEIARERLLEVREMTLQNKLDAMQRAQQEHRNMLEKVKSSIGGITKTNSTQELESEIEIEKEIEEHETEVETITNELKIKIEVKGELTAEQQALIDSVLSFMQNKTGEVKIKIDNKKGETKIKIKQETGKSEEEIEAEIEELEKGKGLFDIKKDKAQDRIEDALEEIAEVKLKLTEVNITEINVTAVNELVSQAESHILKAQQAFNETKFGEAFGQATSAERLAENAERLIEKAVEIEEEREIEVEIEEGRAKVEIEIAGMKMKYILNTTNKEEIVSDIESKTGLTSEEINAIMEFEIEEEEEEKPEVEIEAEIEKNQTKVEVKINKTKSKFTVNSTEEEEIVSEIVEKTGLERTEVKKLLKIEKELEEVEEED